MWTPFVYNNTTYILKLKQNNDKVYIYLTDIKNIWCEAFEKEAIEERFKEENPNVADLNFESCIKQILLLFENISQKDGIIKVQKENDQVVMDIKTKVADFNIKFKINFVLGDEDMFFKEVTVALLQTIGYLEFQQKSLVDLLIKKDHEIQEHVFENGDISRKHIKTEPFDKNSLNVLNDTDLFLNIFNKCSEFNSVFTNKYGASHNVVPNVEEKEKQPIKKPKIHKLSKNLKNKLGTPHVNKE